MLGPWACVDSHLSLLTQSRMQKRRPPYGTHRSTGLGNHREGNYAFVSGLPL
jgi:hypothetical protein